LTVRAPAVGQVDQGTVSFTVTDPGGGVICTTSATPVLPNIDLVTASATATCNIAAGTPIGTYTITPSFSGGANFNPSSTPPSQAVDGTLTITRRATTVTVTCAPNPLYAGDTTTCTATVADSDIGTRSTPTGAVAWS